MSKDDKKICMVIGDPAEHSLSPVIHNAAYKALGIDNQYSFHAKTVHPEDLEDFISSIRSLSVSGVSVTTPHKQAVMQYLDEISGHAKKIGAVNTIVNYEGKLVGHNTDWIGAIEPLKQRTALQGKKAAVIGAGGAAKAFVYGLVQEKAEVTVFNRTVEKAQKLAEQFACDYSSLDNQAKIKDFDIVCNATSAGFAGENKQEDLPINPDNLTSQQIVFEAIYSPPETRLIKTAEEKDAETILGIEMLLCQGFAQFELFTGKEAPKEAMRHALEEYLNEK